LYYIVRPVSKKQKKPGVAAHIYDPNTQEAKAGGPQVQGQPRLQSKIQSQKKKKKKERKKKGREVYGGERLAAAATMIIKERIYRAKH
jgi:hypothetical protein